MQVKELEIVNFRGFSELIVRPKGHVVIMGEPRAGRSDLFRALERALDTHSLRSRMISEMDFHNRDTSQPIRILVTLGDLGVELEQEFFDRIELWDKAEDTLIEDRDVADGVDEDLYEFVLRLGYWANWLSEEERCEETKFFARDSNPDSGVFDRVRQSDIEKLGFKPLSLSSGKVLDLGPRSSFRSVLNESSGDDFAMALSRYVNEVGEAANNFVESVQVKAALEKVLAPLRLLLGVSQADVARVFQFSPEGGSASGLLRSLSPSIDVLDAAGGLPIWQQGSTTVSLFRVAEVLASISREGSIVAVDDLGDGMDSAASAHLAAAIREASGQAWITTRLSAAAEVFEPQEVLRMGIDDCGQRMCFMGRQPTSKAEAIVSKHWHRNLLPALGYRSVVVVEGAHDFSALHSLALRLFNESIFDLPASHRVAIVNSGSSGGGGYAGVLKLAGAAKDLGLRAVAAIDGDKGSEAHTHISRYGDRANVIVRLPDGKAIEAALIDGIPRDVIEATLTEIAVIAEIPMSEAVQQGSISDMTRKSIRFLKKYSMHGQFIDSIPREHIPQLASRYLMKLVEVATGSHTGLVQL